MSLMYLSTSFLRSEPECMDWLAGLMYYLMEGNICFVMPITLRNFSCAGTICTNQYLCPC